MSPKTNPDKCPSCGCVDIRHGEMYERIRGIGRLCRDVTCGNCQFSFTEHWDFIRAEQNETIGSEQIDVEPKEHVFACVDCGQLYIGVRGNQHKECHYCNGSLKPDHPIVPKHELEEIRKAISENRFFLHGSNLDVLPIEFFIFGEKGTDTIELLELIRQAHEAGAESKRKK